MQFTLVSLLAVTSPALVAAQAGIFANVAGYKSLGCYDEPAGQRALSVGSADLTLMTPAFCAVTCAGYTYFGVEYGIECYCGNTLSGGMLDPDASKCDIACVGNTAQNCGGHSTLSLYVLNGNPISPVVSSSTVRLRSSSSILSSSSTARVISSKTTSSTLKFSTSTKTSSTKITTSARITSSKAALVTGFSYVGCFKDRTNVATITVATQMNPAICIAAAKAKVEKYIYVGVESASICIGATTEISKPTSLTGAKACTSTCAGTANAGQTCGGRHQYNLYASVTGSAFSAPVKTQAAV